MQLEWRGHLFGPAGLWGDRQVNNQCPSAPKPKSWGVHSALSSHMNGAWPREELFAWGLWAVVVTGQLVAGDGAGWGSDRTGGDSGGTWDR